MSLSLSSQSVIPTTTPTSPTSTSDSEIDESAAADDDSANPHVPASSMLAVTSTICVVIVLVTAFVVFVLVRRRWAQRESTRVSGQSLRRSTMMTRSGARGSRRVRQNSNLGGRQNPLKLLATSSYDLPKNDVDYALDPRVAAVEFGPQEEHRSRHATGAFRTGDLPPPYGVRPGPGSGVVD